MDEFACQIHETGDAVVVAVQGDVDLATCGTLLTTAAAQLRPGAQMVLDCSQISFMDSMGLSTLLELRQHAEVTGAGFALAAVPRQVRRVLQLSGTEGRFQILTRSPGTASPSWTS